MINPGAPGLPAPDGADVRLNLAISLDQATSRFSINGVSFVPPTAPVLLQILSGAQSPQELLPSGSVYTLPANKVVELTIPGGSPGSPVCRFLGVELLCVTNWAVVVASYPSAWGTWISIDRFVISQDGMWRSIPLTSSEVREARCITMTTRWVTVRLNESSDIDQM